MYRVTQYQDLKSGELLFPDISLLTPEEFLKEVMYECADPAILDPKYQQLKALAKSKGVSVNQLLKAK